jgi:microcystin degradation protein MlrC
MKIFAAGIATETNTFSPLPTGLSDYAVERGRDAHTATGSTFDLPAIWGSMARARGDTFVFSLMAWAQPGGVTTRAAYESLRDEMLADLRAAAPVDVVLLMLHGAMIAQGYDDCEADMIRRVRDIVGADTVIGVELDLHCHLSQAKIEAANLVITYKEYPHDDINERAAELFELAMATRMGRIRPTMALFDCRMAGLYPTSREPMRGFVEELKAAEQRERVLSVSFGHGFQYADVPHVGSKMLVITDDDPALAEDLARALGEKARALRPQIGFDGLSQSLDEALSRAMHGPRRPVVVADQSDNIGGGAPGDATFALRWLLEHGASDAALAIFYDPEVVKIAKKAGEGAALSLRIGGKLGVASGEPLDLDVTVEALLREHHHPFPQQSGAPVLFPLGDVARLRCGGIDIVVSSERCQCFSPSIFTDVGIDPATRRILVVKSVQHFYRAFAPLAAEVIYMAGPGAVPPDPRRLSYARLDTKNMYPWSDDGAR